MKKILILALLLIPALLQAQDMSHRYFHYNQYFDAPAPFTITANTIDGTDTNIWSFCAGGACGTTRGAGITAQGDDVGGAGAGGGITYEAGTGTTGFHYFQKAGLLDWTIGTDLTQNATNGGDISMTKAATGVRVGTVGLAADVTTALTSAPQYFAFTPAAGAGGVALVEAAADASSSSFNFFKSRKVDGTADTIVNDADVLGRIWFYGADGANFIPAAMIQSTVNGTPGATDMPGNLSYWTTPDAGSAPVIRWTMPTGAATVSDFVFGASTVASSVATIRGARADGSDDGMLQLAGGGLGADRTRGASILISGNEAGYTGSMRLNMGDSGNSYFAIYDGTGGREVTFNNDADADDATMIFGNSVTTAPVFTIRGQTADGDDDGTLNLCSGGACGTTRGAGISLLAADVGGAGAGGGITYEAATGTTGTHKFNTAGTLKWTIGTDITQAAAGGNLVFVVDKTGVIDSTEPTGALGTVLADAVLIAANVTFVTGADAAKGVKFPVAPIGGQRFVIYNTANAVLKVWPGEATDNINALADGLNVEVAAYGTLYCHASSADIVWCGELANP